MTLCLGIDPDLHDLAIASWDGAGPVRAHVVHVPKRKGVTENYAVIEMMTALSGTLPSFGRYFDESYHLTAPPHDDGHFPDSCAVEAQELARGPGAQHRRPQDIVTLGQVAGMALMRVARGCLHGCALYFPKPSEWKGQVEKHAMQGRLYQELGWGYEIIWKGHAPVRGGRKGDYAIPQTPEGAFADISRAQWKHVGDALLLARWCWEQQVGRKWRAKNAA